MKIYFCFCAVSILMAACNSNSGSSPTTTTTQPVMNVNTTAPISSKTTIPQLIQTVPNATTTPVAVEVTNATEQTTISNNSKNEKITLNPAHGLPGHRCDLTVGAPLNSAAAPKPAATTQTATVTAPPTTLISKTQPAVVSAKLNPAHGQPGHRCDLTVGAPLSSAPASKPAATTQPATVTAQPSPVVTTPAVVANTTQASGVKPKLNPTHGQPFHDCSIEVGKPLKN